MVTLTYPDGTSKSVRTDEEGKYQFDGLKNGLTYKITFETPEGYTPTHKHSGTNPALDSEGNSVLVTINGQDDMTIDSGFYQTPKYSLGNYVWYDTNKDGI